ncbi:MAG TPA: DUF6600 domain-containing protein, partial [Aliidongia sp.]|uniref:DUF6600 domain-containing protein n=1 Tax=Aliidongia sp. TaxID=1914230 RepID=UPI002DDCBF0D
MPIQRRTVRSGHSLAVAFVALSVSGFGPMVQAFAQDAPPPDGTVQQDPPSRVGYVSLVEGTVSMHANATDPWAPAALNYPLTAGTSLWTEPGAKAEIQIGAARIDLDGGTEVDLVAIDDQNVDINVPQGRADVHLHGRQPNESYEVTVPRGTTALGVDGTYRIIAGDDQAPTRIAALYGSAQLIEPSGTVPVETNNELIVTAGDPLAYTQQALQDDAFDHWVADRMHRFDHPPARQYVSPQVVGAENLEQYGTWQTTPQYGAVWMPSSVAADWAPYREGHWRWVAPWGWTWVDDEPWGFAPFHYGRWTQFDGRWGWVPGTVVERPVYAPAMVAFVGGEPGPRPGVGIAVGIGIGVGIGAAIGWVPLGPGEVYRPPYRVSERYIRNVNVTNVSRTEINNITVNKTVNVTNVTYANQRAVTVVNHDAFVNARPVRQAALPAAQAATFTHPIVASAGTGRPGAAAPAALPQPTAASRVGAEAAARPIQAPPQTKLQMPTTHMNGQGHVVPTAVPAPAATAGRPGPAGAAAPNGAPQPHVQPQAAPQPG